MVIVFPGGSHGYYHSLVVVSLVMPHGCCSACSGLGVEHVVGPELDKASH